MAAEDVEVRNVKNKGPFAEHLMSLIGFTWDSEVIFSTSEVHDFIVRKFRNEPLRKAAQECIAVQDLLMESSQPGRKDAVLAVADVRSRILKLVEHSEIPDRKAAIFDG